MPGELSALHALALVKVIPGANHMPALLAKEIPIEMNRHHLEETVFGTIWTANYHIWHEVAMIRRRNSALLPKVMEIRVHRFPEQTNQNDC